jgi:hypothetical protein
MALSAIVYSSLPQDNNPQTNAKWTIEELAKAGKINGYSIDPNTGQVTISNPELSSLSSMLDWKLIGFSTNASTGFTGVAFQDLTTDEIADGWRPLAESAEKQTILLEKLRMSRHEALADALDIPAMAAQSARFTFHNDSLVHNDVRADNGAWNQSLQAVKLIDWNWAQISDRRIDINSLLVHVHRSRFDVSNEHASWLNADALQWLAGFWLHSAAETNAHNTSEITTLEDYQLLSGIAALELRDTLISK